MQRIVINRTTLHYKKIVTFRKKLQQDVFLRLCQGSEAINLFKWITKSGFSWKEIPLL